jgi:hypothetical protein
MLAHPASLLAFRAEGWQSGRMRRSRKPLSVVRRIEGSNPSPSASARRAPRRHGATEIGSPGTASGVPGIG